MLKSRAFRSLDRVHVIAPAGPVESTTFARGLATLRHHLGPDASVVVADNVDSRTGYLAGPDTDRLASWRAAAADPGASVLWCARGGYGTTRLLSRLDAEALRDAPKLLVGFSDITALLCWAWTRAEVPSVHGPVVTQLGKLPPEDLQRVLALVRGEVPPPLEANCGTVYTGGVVEGRLIVGNLEVLRSLIGTPFFPNLDGCILALEEIGERPYRIDRSLTHLMSSGALRGVRGVVIGQLALCDEPTDRTGATPEPSALEVVGERLGLLGVPIVTGFPFGHENRNAALPFGTKVRLDAPNATLEFLEPVAHA